MIEQRSRSLEHTLTEAVFIASLLWFSKNSSFNQCHCRMHQMENMKKCKNLSKRYTERKRSCNQSVRLTLEEHNYRRILFSYFKSGKLQKTKPNLTTNLKQATSSSARYSLSITQLKLQNCQLPHYGENLRLLLYP